MGLAVSVPPLPRMTCTMPAFFSCCINQIARSVNAGIARAEDAKRGLFLLDQVYELMYQIAKK